MPILSQALYSPRFDNIKKITTRDEIDLELPGQERCAYFLVTSDQDSTFDFLASLFLSFCFIKLVRYADKNCEGGKLPYRCMSWVKN